MKPPIDNRESILNPASISLSLSKVRTANLVVKEKLKAKEAIAIHLLKQGIPNVAISEAAGLTTLEL